MKIIKIFFCILLSFFITIANAEILWNMATPYPDATFHTKNIRQFAKEVEKLTKDKIKIKVHSAGSLFKHPEISRAVRSNQVQAGEFFLSLLNNENNVFGVDSIPFLASNYKEAKRLWKVQRPFVEKLFDKQNLKVLYAVPWPPQGLYTKKKVNSIKDLSGLKFRSYNSILEKFATLVKAVPTQIEVPDIPQAFATNRVEAMITSPSTGVNSKVWDYLSYYTDIQAWIPKNIVVVNKKSFAKLNSTVKKKILQSAEKAERRGWQMSKNETKNKILELKKNGINVRNPSKKLKLELKSIGKTMLKNWIDSADVDGKKMLKDYYK